MRKYEAAAKLEAKSEVLGLKVESNRQLDNAGKILDMFVDDKIPDNITFGEVKKRAFGILPRDKFSLVRRYISKAGFDQTRLEWKELESLAQKLGSE